jgi:glycosyltransferase involved in cell wall biosynthesis
MKILFLSRLFPYPPSNGTKLRVYNFLRGLAGSHDVTLLAFNDQPEIEPDVQGLTTLCSRVEFVPMREHDPTRLRSLVGLIIPMPRFLWDTFSRDMAKKISAMLQDQDFDLVIASNMTMASYRPYYKNIPAILEEIEIGSYYDEIYSREFKKRFRRSLSWFKFRFYLSRLLQSFQAATVVSSSEMKVIEQIAPRQANKIVVLPNCVSVDEYVNLESKPKPKSLIYSGSFKYSANYEAMLWFVGEIFPLVLGKAPDTHLSITGDHAGLSLPSHHNITLTGHVDNIKEIIASAWVSIVPLKSGGGTRLKILEAMAIGVPVVATTKGAEGLDAVPGTHFLLGNTAREFADQVLRVLNTPDLHDELGRNARKLVEQNYNWKTVFPLFLDLVERTAMDIVH